MKKLIAVIIIVGAVLLLAMTCPDKTAHQEAIRDSISQAYNDKVNESMSEEDASNELVQGFAMLGNMFVDKIVETVLDTKLSVKNYVLFSVGSIYHDGNTKTVSFGILTNVFTYDKEDIKNLIDDNK